MLLPASGNTIRLHASDSEQTTYYLITESAILCLLQSNAAWRDHAQIDNASQITTDSVESSSWAANGGLNRLYSSHMTLFMSFKSHHYDVRARLCCQERTRVLVVFNETDVAGILSEALPTAINVVLADDRLLVSTYAAMP